MRCRISSRLVLIATKNTSKKFAIISRKESRKKRRRPRECLLRFKLRILWIKRLTSMGKARWVKLRTVDSGTISRQHLGPCLTLMVPICLTTLKSVSSFKTCKTNSQEVLVTLSWWNSSRHKKLRITLRRSQTSSSWERCRPKRITDNGRNILLSREILGRGKRRRKKLEMTR